LAPSTITALAAAPVAAKVRVAGRHTSIGL
jgi:hypothetical protein